jgi:hypothetical protein
MSEAFLHRAEVIPILPSMRGKGMAQGMGRDSFGQRRCPGSMLHRLLPPMLMEVMAASHPTAWLDRQARAGKHVLPAPCLRGLWILPGQCVGEQHGPISRLEIVRVQALLRGEMGLQRRDQALRQRDDAILWPLPIADGDLAIGKIAILHAQPHTFHAPPPGAIYQGRHEAVAAVHGRPQLRDLRPGEHHGESLWALGWPQAVAGVERLVPDLGRKERQGGACLIVGSGRHLARHGQVLEKASTSALPTWLGLAWAHKARTRSPHCSYAGSVRME